MKHTASCIYNISSLELFSQKLSDQVYQAEDSCNQNMDDYHKVPFFFFKKGVGRVAFIKKPEKQIVCT